MEDTLILQHIGFPTMNNPERFMTFSYVCDTSGRIEKVYMDGTLMESKSSSASLDTQVVKKLRLGGTGHPNTTSYLLSKMYCARIYDRILSDEEIKNNAEADKVRFEAGTN